MPIHLDALLRMPRTESFRIEMTTNEKDTHKFAEAICAFANDLPDGKLPGYLIVGMNDQGGVVGVEDGARISQIVADLRDNGQILPRPAVSVTVLPSPQGDLVVAEVLPSDMPPVRYKDKVCVRVAARRGYASPQEEKILTEKRISRARTFDCLPCRESSFTDIAADLFLAYRSSAVSQEAMMENNRPLEDQLAALRLYDVASGVRCPTNAGLIGFGKDPRYFLLGDYVQYVRFAGTDMEADSLDHKEISGDIQTILRTLEIYITTNIAVSADPRDGLRQEQKPEYPFWAVRELLINAIMHRDYEANAPVRLYWFGDRVEIQNPGGLYGVVDKDNFERQNDYRNPVIAEILKTLGYVERFGSGIRRAKKALLENNNPEPEFCFEKNYALVTIRKRICKA